MAAGTGTMGGTTTIEVDGRGFRATDVRAALGEDFGRLPVVLRLLAENTLRRSAAEEGARTVRNLRRWLEARTSEEELEFWPQRVLMHDTTSTPALVDIAAMRDSLAEAGVDPAVLNPVLPRGRVGGPFARRGGVRAPRCRPASTWRTSCAATPSATASCAGRRRPCRRAHPPARHRHHAHHQPRAARDGGDHRSARRRAWVVPDMMIGTDSHTPMVNGIGVLGWGVGGLEAQTVMFGMPTMLRIPDVIGVQLTARLGPGVLATDLALTVTQRLRELGVAGEFVEFFGPGVSTLTAGERAVVANMAPEYGATTGYFPVDARTLDYLRDTGRDAASARARRGLRPRARPLVRSRRPTRATRARSRSTSPPSACTSPARAGRRTCCRSGETRAALAGEEPRVRSPRTAAMPRLPGRHRGDHELHQHHRSEAAHRRRPGRPQGAHRGPERAGLGEDLAGPGLARGRALSARAPGSLDDLGGVGFDIVGFGCTTCIGNSGPAARADQEPRRRGPHPPGRGALGQPQLPRPHAPGPGSGLHHVAAAGGRVRARRRCGASTCSHEPCRCTGRDGAGAS